jgi:tetratricopeptide (TPR) repeat protein
MQRDQVTCLRPSAAWWPDRRQAACTWALATALLILSCAGCQLTNSRQATSQERTSAAESPDLEVSTKLFEERRDRAMMEAAVARWRENDVAGCSNLLERLLQRNPQYRPARMLLADLLVSQQRSAEAEAQLRWLVQSDARDAQAHHSLGLLLESTGRGGEAMSHIQQAAQLEPANRLYSLSYDVLLAGLSPRTPPLATPAPIVQTRPAPPTQPQAAERGPVMMAEFQEFDAAPAGIWPPPVGR